MNLIQYKDVPVSLFLAVSIIIVSLLYITTFIKTIPCQKNMSSIFYSHFIHVELYHLIANLFALYVLSRVERDIGGKKFMMLIVFLLVITSLAEVLIHKIIHVPCSIGFSGILFGVMAYEITSKKGFDWLLFVSISGVIASSSLQDSKSSLIGHTIGAISGIMAGIIWNYINKIK